ncbi:outer membrane beta-barrel protein [Flavivirga sp. 57AJ16]|uniref:outer membrane beta-barrel protein n=1 Tax=Flavivirga sp. 57AJ16 TaxID=3025307 RepID=UPI0023672C20|nr:outer membrane beta-barrel protein [Flavivirga sp. 57AJ16]MDD7886931.1 outer membrane beta-barrel protein [Flavivirga sp. 57AJ16]
MKTLFIVLLFVASLSPIFAQTGQDAKFYIGASYGTSFSLGDFGDTDISNPDAGFADNGNKLDLFGGYFLNNKVTLTGTFRYQTFDTKIGNLIEEFNADNPGSNFSGSTEDWNVYSLLVGAAYKINIYKKFSLFPRVGVGPMVVSNPGITISSPDDAVAQSFSRSSESGIGVGYEFGIGLKTDLGKHFALMPTFTFSGGFATITDVNTTTDTLLINSNYDVKIQSFNLGLSIAYKFQ